MNEMMGGFMERPKHAMGGVASGLKCVAGGALAGVVGLVAMPVIGAKENGVKGFAAGVGKGVAGLVVLPAAGAIAGAVQITRGVVNTPNAISGTASGKQWDTGPGPSPRPRPSPSPSPSPSPNPSPSPDPNPNPNPKIPARAG